jgi:hypothetical protein
MNFFPHTLKGKLGGKPYNLIYINVQELYLLKNCN